MTTWQRARLILGALPPWLVFSTPTVLVWAWLFASTSTAVTLTVPTLGLLVALLIWGARDPSGFERWVGSPLCQRSWRRWMRAAWPELAKGCGLSAPAPGMVRDWKGTKRAGTVHVPPRLVSVRTTPTTMSVTLRTRLGQTSDDLLSAAQAIREAASAQTVRGEVIKPGTVRFDLVMVDPLTLAHDAVMPEPGVVDLHAVPVGRTETGDAWRVQVARRHTLVVGRSDGGKSGLVRSLVLGMAPAIGTDTVRLHMVDLKYGLELTLVRALSTTAATTEDEALALLRYAVDIAKRRGEAMARRGITQHVPTPGDPLHVVLIDELASLTAYADREVTKEADKLLRALLSRGRAVGVVVIGALQDPRKETIPARGLFTQTIALSLADRAECVMVLGEGAADLAPAHRLGLDHPGMAYVVHNGTADRVRADYVSEDLMREAGRRFPGRHETLPARYFDASADETPETPAAPVPHLSVVTPTAPTSADPGPVTTSAPAPARRRQPKRPRAAAR